MAGLQGADALKAGGMTSRRRVSPTLADKLGRLAAVHREHATEPGVYRLSVTHDPACPALRTQSLADCRCEPEIRPPEKLT